MTHQQEDLPRPSITELWEDRGGTVMQREDSKGNRMALCPLHNETNPSASINEDEGLWKCWGCDKGGDQYAFIMEAWSVKFVDAIGIAQSFAGDGDGGVRETARQQSSLVPHRQGSRPGRRHWSPPWRM